MEIEGNVKNYDWGRRGKASVVAELAALNKKDFVINAGTPYSELWMGDHPSGPSIIKSTGEELSKALPNNLSFLFKVLSIQKALSIQVHPNKSEAARLHKERPDIYKDGNHKPELAIAITNFTALCGFRPYGEIHQFCQDLPPLKNLLGEANVQELKSNDAAAAKAGLRKCYEKLMTTNQADTDVCINDIANNYMQVLQLYCLQDVFNTVKRDFPQDVGVLSLFFLNLLKLKPGEAIFLGANEIHAYLSGDCIEAMACSDNVIRAGLTPKYKDVAQLISCLNYDGQQAARKVFQPKCIDQCTQVFAPPVDDFAVIKIHLNVTVKNYKFKMQQYDAILLTLKGTNTLRLKAHSDLPLKRGSIIYIPAEAALEIEFIADTCAKEDFVAYIATYNYFKK